MTKPLSETTVTLMKARNILEKGWCQGALQKGDRYCILGALDEAGFGSLRPAACIQSVCGDGDIAHFNDAPNRIHAEVLEVMDKAIQRSMEEG